MERVAICSATEKIIPLVGASWSSSPLTVVRMCSACGSGISSAETIHGPTGPCVSNDLPIVMVGAFSCQSRTVTSSTIVYPATTSSARSTGT